MREYFSELLGNENSKEKLGAAIERGTLPHAILIVGPKGSGKRTLAKEISAALNCENKNSDRFSLPCCSCNTCRRIKENNYTDITYLKRDKDRATIGVEEVRNFRSDMFLSSTESSYKIYVIEDADKLTHNAQNALLTVLEEPPKNVIILLLASSLDNILTTIKSRAQSIFMSRFDRDTLKEYLIKKSDKARNLERASKESFDSIIISSDGILGKAISLLSENDALENAEERAVIINIISSLRSSAQYSELYSAISSLPTGRQDFLLSLELLLSAIRDAEVIKLSQSAGLLFFSSHEQAAKYSNEISAKRLMQVYELINDALKDTARNVAISAITSNLAAKIKLI